MITKKFKLAELNTKIVSVSLEWENFKNDLIAYKCLFCNQNYPKKKKFWWKL